MHIKGTGKNARVVIDEEGLEFASSMRGQYIISQALVYAIERLKKYEEVNDLSQMEPSNRADMEYLLDVFPLYRIHDAIKDEQLTDAINNSIEEIKKQSTEKEKEDA